MTTAVTERPMPTGEGLTFEKVWAMFQETDKQIKETDKQIKESAQETERLIQRMMEKSIWLDKQLEETKRLIAKTGRASMTNGRYWGR
jgi:hypothetical protein